MVGANKSVTSIIVSHRMSTVTRCDSIVVIDGGKIVQQGTHQELLEDKNGIYATLVSHQLLKN
jgi:ABC-type multidrug transport system fused ATPase/permease subunit